MIAELRDRKLRELIRHAYERIPYYRHLLDEREVKPESIEGMQDLPRLPIMTKEMFRAHYADLRAIDVPDDRVIVGQTGGTSGIPVRTVWDSVTGAWSLASYVRGLSWAGLRLRDRRVRLFGGTLGLEKVGRLDPLRKWFRGEVPLAAFELGPDTVRGYAARIRRSGAAFLIGYASACYSLAKLAGGVGQPLSFRAVLPTAELCQEGWADTIARAFSAQVLPYYGCGEVNSLGYSCPEGGVYHTCDEHAIIEVEKENAATALQGEGAFLITDLDNRAIPMIRYRNGDAGYLEGPGCRCGRALGRIVRLDGRVMDMLLTASGEKVSGVIGSRTMRYIHHVESYQFVQRAPGHVTVRIVREPGYDPAVEEAKIYGSLVKHLGDDAKIEIQYVDAIARTSAGKTRFVINECLDGNQPSMARQ